MTQYDKPSIVDEGNTGKWQYALLSDDTLVHTGCNECGGEIVNAKIEIQKQYLSKSHTGDPVPETRLTFAICNNECNNVLLDKRG